MLSRVCEEFGCTPPVGIDLLDWDSDLIVDILAMRNYVHVKHAIDRAKTEDQVPKTPVVDTVMEIEYELLQERRRQREAEDE